MYAVMVRSKEGWRFVDSTNGPYWENRIFVSTWSIENTLMDALLEANRIGGFVVPEDKRYEYVGFQ